MTRALERHSKGEARVIPIILRPCEWQESPFGKLLALPKDGKPVTKFPNQDEAFLEITRGVRAAVHDFCPPAETPTYLPATVDSKPIPEVRSSNLRVRRTFSDQDRDDFLEQAFEFIANYFEGSLTELAQRAHGITARFRRIDTNHFTAALYRDGNAESQCKIWLSREECFSNSIHYSSDLSMGENSYNESLTIEDNGYSMFVNPSMRMCFDGNQAELLSKEGAAEYLWEMLIQPLQ